MVSSEFSKHKRSAVLLGANKQKKRAYGPLHKNPPRYLTALKTGENSGADNGIRTRDTKLGKLVLYQLSYVRPRLPTPGERSLPTLHRFGKYTGFFVVVKGWKPTSRNRYPAYR